MQRDHAVQLYPKNLIVKGPHWMRDLDGTQGHRNCHSIDPSYHFLSMVCSNKASILLRFSDFTTFIVYATACDLGRCSSVENEITGHMLSVNV